MISVNPKGAQVSGISLSDVVSRQQIGTFVEMLIGAMHKPLVGAVDVDFDPLSNLLYRVSRTDAAHIHVVLGIGPKHIRFAEALTEIVQSATSLLQGTTLAIETRKGTPEYEQPDPSPVVWLTCAICGKHDISEHMHQTAAGWSYCKPCYIGK